MKNINFFNNAVSNVVGENVPFHESINDWESSQTHRNFKTSSELVVYSITIDSLLKDYSLDDYNVIIKLDIEGNEINAIKGALEIIKKSHPLIIIEFSKYIFMLIFYGFFCNFGQILGIKNDDFLRQNRAKRSSKSEAVKYEK